MSDSELLGKFESLGDNCEFGFVQRRAGIEPGGLLRWAITTPNALVAGLANRFEGIYVFDNLVPFSKSMVMDRFTGFKFHSAMTSTNGEFDLGVHKRREIHPNEYEKIVYLREKLLAQLETGKKTFVYKRNSGVDNETLKKLGQAVSQFGSSRLLCVKAHAEKSGTAEIVSDGLAIGYIDRFAPYASAKDIAYDSWIKMLTRYNESMG